jgi:hypothetical protein
VAGSFASGTNRLSGAAEPVRQFELIFGHYLAAPVISGESIVVRLLTAAFLVVTLPAVCQPAYSEKAVLKYARGLDVSKLDPALSSQRLEVWLKSGPPHAHEVTWRLSDCDLKLNGEKPRNQQPLCVRFGFRRGTIGGWGIVTVGTVAKGVEGTPHFENAQVASGPPNPKGRTATRLSQIPVLLDALAAKD